MHAVRPCPRGWFERLGFEECAHAGPQERPKPRLSAEEEERLKVAHEAERKRHRTELARKRRKRHVEEDRKRR